MDEEELLHRLNRHYGSQYRPEGRLTLKKEKLFLYTGEDTKLKTDWAGLHIANADLSLTIEGAQKLGTTAAKNAVEIAKEEAEAYFRGEDLNGPEGNGPLILRTKDRIIGPGRLEDGKIRNILPASRKTRY